MLIKFQSVVVLIVLNVVILTSASENSNKLSNSNNFLNLLHDNEQVNPGADSSAVFDAISKLSERRQQSLVKRDLLKRVQVPFKWGKRSPNEATGVINAQLDQCADLFIILVGPNRVELTRFDRNELKVVFDSCFSIWLDTLFTNAARANLDQSNSSEEDYEPEQVAKRSNNLPFKWG